MKWTEEKPTKEGYYWFEGECSFAEIETKRVAINPELVRVSKHHSFLNEEFSVQFFNDLAYPFSRANGYFERIPEPEGE